MCELRLIVVVVVGSNFFLICHKFILIEYIKTSAQCSSMTLLILLFKCFAPDYTYFYSLFIMYFKFNPMSLFALICMVGKRIFDCLGWLNDRIKECLFKIKTVGWRLKIKFLWNWVNCVNLVNFRENVFLRNSNI